MLGYVLEKGGEGSAGRRGVGFSGSVRLTPPTALYWLSFVQFIRVSGPQTTLPYA